MTKKEGHYAGEEVNEIFETLPNTGNDYDTEVTKLTEYFSPKKNTELKVYKFRQAKQEAGGIYHVMIFYITEKFRPVETTTLFIQEEIGKLGLKLEALVRLLE